MSLTLTVTAAADLAGGVVAGDLFQTGSDFATKAQNMLIAAGAAAIAWGLVKALFRSPTLLTGILALLGAAGLFWLLNNIRSPELSKPFDDTVKNMGAPQLDRRGEDPALTGRLTTPARAAADREDA